MQVPPQLLTWNLHACFAQAQPGEIEPLEGLIGIVPGRVHFGDFHGRMHADDSNPTSCGPLRQPAKAADRASLAVQ
jgi:hypothetical protein